MISCRVTRTTVTGLFALALSLAGCGGDGSRSSGPTTTSTTAAPAPPPLRFMVTAIAEGPFSTSPPGSTGCVILHADSPPGDTACGSNVSTAGDKGTRGTVTAVPASGYRFIRWSSSSSDCPGETKNPCSFAFDRSKTMVAVFGP
jgi:hypothetical protein